MALERSLRRHGRQVLGVLTCTEIHIKCSRGLYWFVARRYNSSEGSRVKNDDDPEFRVFEIKGLKAAERRKARVIHRTEVPPDRSQRLKPDFDWTAVWPTRSSYKSSVVPFPVRQGRIKNMEENKGVPPAAYANAELMKIPNFLHLTPGHIKAHCQAIKKFCTPWPKGLETDEKCEEHFPLEISYSNYLSAGPSIRNPKARGVTCKLKLSRLELDYHGRDKLIRLAGDRYNPETGEITLSTDRCPMVKQNKDFVMYLLTALFFEAQKVEAWEEEKTGADMERYFWDISPSRKTLVRLLTRIHNADQEKGGEASTNPSPEDLLKPETVQQYKTATCDLINKGENPEQLDSYRQAVLRLFNLDR